MLSNQVAQLINEQINKEPLLETLQREESVIVSINNIYAGIFGNKEFRTIQFLECFIKEQGEEEKNAGDLIKKYELSKEDGKDFYLLNQKLSAHVYTPSSLVI